MPGRSFSRSSRLRLNGRIEGEFLSEFLYVMPPPDDRQGPLFYFLRGDMKYQVLSREDLGTYQDEHTSLLDPLQGDVVRQQQLPEDRRALLWKEHESVMAAMRSFQALQQQDQRSPVRIFNDFLLRLKVATRVATEATERARRSSSSAVQTRP